MCWKATVDGLLMLSSAPLRRHNRHLVGLALMHRPDGVRGGS